MFKFVFSIFSQVAKVFKAVQKPVRNARGAILIEFAVCVPILILLLFGLHDIFRMARYQDQTNFVAHEVVQMIQNISQNRPNKRITARELEYIWRFACYSMYPGKTIYVYSMKPRPGIHIFYVKGESGGKASIKWFFAGYSHADMPYYYSLPTNSIENIASTIGRYATTPSGIYPTLQINEGEVKIIVEVYTYSSPPRKTFGLYLLSPRLMAGSNAYFNSVTIFTPKRGLFDENPPE